MERHKERRLLQGAVALACLVPISAGLAGAAEGTGLIGGRLPTGNPDLESHFRYLSGLLLGLGLAFAASLPTIERRAELFTVLSALVVVGGIARLLGLLAHDWPGAPHLLALGMELLVLPLLFVWQRRVARRFAGPRGCNSSACSS
jgi:hypothetical protein